LIIRRNLLCTPVLPPSAAGIDPAAVMLPPPDPTMTTRQQLEQRTSPAQCQACHSQLNGFGFALENYDAVGRYRTMETIWDDNGKVLNTLPINSVVTPNIDKIGDRQVSSLKELAYALANSTSGPSCLPRQWFTYVHGHEPDLNLDRCTLKQLYDALMTASSASQSGDQNATLLNMFKAIAFDPHFKLHKQGPTQ
jgi:hypothetical protein